ncbi:hypothetical protein [Agrobacterium rosae]|uniref:hypothetical protein n=1 Tax=Agrobacterium rosae TaxID=1972867 RepID=UPI00122F7BAA|nr:hypothetical protein [Agrobacterium rosae]KAA3510131.1 hypothetical protein DXM21_20085 [Agrobacterium rosae]KAA3514924.1 hypothetical protein DXM25_20285 [Agrobacterium rosae]MQB50752.1 hypothetical protein [Agrobacterium rosae]
MTRDDLKCVVDNACVSNAAGPDYLWPGFLLDPRLWEALRIELQSRYRRSTGEAMAVLTVQLTTETGPGLANDPALIGIADEMKESGGHWQPCTGCYDTEDGYPTQKYDYSPALQTAIGCGCHECGGLGAVWWHMTEQELSDFAKICTEDDSDEVRPGYLDFIVPDEVFDKGPDAVIRWQKAYSAELSGQRPPVSAAIATCPTCNGTGKEGRHSICRDCDGNLPPQTKIEPSDDLRKRVMRAIFDPGATESFKGDRDLTTWQTDAVMRALAATDGQP